MRWYCRKCLLTHYVERKHKADYIKDNAGCIDHKRLRRRIIMLMLMTMLIMIAGAITITITIIIMLMLMQRILGFWLGKNKGFGQLIQLLWPWTDLNFKQASTHTHSPHTAHTHPTHSPHTHHTHTTPVSWHTLLASFCRPKRRCPHFAHCEKILFWNI